MEVVPVEMRLWMDRVGMGMEVRMGMEFLRLHRRVMGHSSMEILRRGNNHNNNLIILNHMVILITRLLLFLIRRLQGIIQVHHPIPTHRNHRMREVPLDRLVRPLRMARVRVVERRILLI